MRFVHLSGSHIVGLAGAPGSTIPVAEKDNDYQ